MFPPNNFIEEKNKSVLFEWGKYTNCSALTSTFGARFNQASMIALGRWKAPNSRIAELDRIEMKRELFTS